MDTPIWVYADWILPDGKGFDTPQCIGELTKDSELNNLRNLTCLFIPALNALNRCVE